MAADDDVDGQNKAAAFRWRCVDAARYLVALAVTALMVTVIAHAISVLLRPDDLFLRVDKGSVAVEPGTPAGNLSFALVLEVANPSGRVVIYYHQQVKAYLYGRANSASEARYFAAIPIEDISLKQQSTKFVYLHSYPALNTPDLKHYFDLFNSSGNKGIPDGMVVVNGTLTVGLYSWRNQTGKPETYYCWPVAIGGDASDSENTAGGAQCRDSPPTPQAILPDNP